MCQIITINTKEQGSNINIKLPTKGAHEEGGTGDDGQESDYLGDNSEVNSSDTSSYNHNYQTMHKEVLGKEQIYKKMTNLHVECLFIAHIAKTT